MDVIDGYTRAQHLFTKSLESLGHNPWPRETACAEWTVGDVLGHVTWGQDLIRSLADNTEFYETAGAPGTASPATYIEGEPMEAWLRAREATARALTAGRLGTPLPPDRFGDGATLASFAEILEFDSVVHAWDITYPHGIELDVSGEHITRISRTAERVVTRRPGFFAPEATAPDDTDPLTRLMLFCGRSDATG